MRPPARAAAPRPAAIATAATAPTPHTRNIEAIRPGDSVLARDDATGEVAPRRVVQLFRNTADHLRIIRIRAADGCEQELRTTDGHPFFVVDRGWVAAGALEAGQTVLQADGRAATVAVTRREEHPEGVPVYNFEVEVDHNYFVAQGASDAAVLVHNQCETTAVHEAGHKVNIVDPENWTTG